jgi:murein DD-endopeptidase MepM/ murein hydrolase activator NlpD
MQVKKGDNVSQGSTIAHVGTTGNVREPQLHFSLREGREARDPLTVLSGDQAQGLNVASR